MRAFLTALILSLAVSLITGASTAAAQEIPQDWEGKKVLEIKPLGFYRTRWMEQKYKLRIRESDPLTKSKLDDDLRELWASGQYDSVEILPKPAPDMPDAVIVHITVREYPLVESVEFSGVTAFPVEKLREPSRVPAGSPLNPAKLKEGTEELKNRYLQDGYYFSQVEPVQTPTPGGINLRWNVIEGPKVTVAEVHFTGNEGLTEGELKDVMVGAPENSWLLGLIPLQRKPFVLRNLQHDLVRMEQHYVLNGWLDVAGGDRIFIENLSFNRDKTLAFVTIHVEEGPRYSIRSVSVRGNTIFSQDELMKDLRTKPGQPYDERKMMLDARRIQGSYGERAYIMAEVRWLPLVAEQGTDVDLVFDIKENEKVYVGTLHFTGNDKTRDDVLRREFTRREFVPGEEYNLRSFERAVLALQDRGFIDRLAPGRGYRIRHDPGLLPGTRDVTLDIQEGETGNVHFGAGYSTAHGITGVFEYVQRNFDIADLPDDLGEVFTGDAFSGGGQVLRLKVFPSARRQYYALEFTEPYLFGYELEGSLNARRITQSRPSWDDDVLTFGAGLDKRFDPWSVGIGFEYSRHDVVDIEADAPSDVVAISGRNISWTAMPRIRYSTLDSIIFPTEGMRASASVEYAGQVLPGDYDYNKLVLTSDYFIPLWETPEDRLRYVFHVEGRFGWAHPERDWDELPVSERFRLGGRGTMRGFDYEGIGPRQNGDPVGGQALVFGSAEFLIPLFSPEYRLATFYDIGTLEPELDDLHDSHFRSSVGFGLRFLFPLGGVPLSLDFAWPIWKDDEDERQTVTFDLGELFFR